MFQNQLVVGHTVRYIHAKSGIYLSAVYLGRCWHPSGTLPQPEDNDMKEWIELYRQREEGAVGYILMWLLGVPASLLFVVFLLRGCN